jgi:hypothetical protein
VTAALARTPSLAPTPPLAPTSKRHVPVRAQADSLTGVARTLCGARDDGSGAEPRRLPYPFGRFTLFDHIGRGGMADIYLAKLETSLGGRRLLVVKELLPRLSLHARFGDMLVAEAKLCAGLSHANVVKVEELGRAEGSLYVAMEYVEGLDLRELLKRCAREGVPMPIEYSLFIVREVLRGLDYAHRYRVGDGSTGIVHRDVSPSNVLLSFDGEVKLCDFGIARAIDLAPGAAPTEAVCGKAGYMSPEQARGAVVDARADVWSAAVILWELLAGRRLHRASPGPELLELAKQGDVPALPARGLPNEDELHRAVMRALERDPDLRTPTTRAFAEELDAFVAATAMDTSPLRLGAWLRETFGAELVERRRARQRALLALERGPAARIVPIARPALAPAADPAGDVGEAPPREPAPPSRHASERGRREAADAPSVGGVRLRATHAGLPPSSPLRATGAHRRVSLARRPRAAPAPSRRHGAAWVVGAVVFAISAAVFLLALAQRV